MNQSDVFTGRVIYNPIVTGFTADLQQPYAEYTLFGDACTVYFPSGIRGTSNSREFSFSLPFVSGENRIESVWGIDNGVVVAVDIKIEFGSNVAVCYKQPLRDRFIVCGTKGLQRFTFQYRILTTPPHD